MRCRSSNHSQDLWMVFGCVRGHENGILLSDPSPMKTITNKVLCLASAVQAHRQCLRMGAAILRRGVELDFRIHVLSQPSRLHWPSSRTVLYLPRRWHAQDAALGHFTFDTTFSVCRSFGRLDRCYLMPLVLLASISCRRLVCVVYLHTHDGPAATHLKGQQPQRLTMRCSKPFRRSRWCLQPAKRRQN